MTEVQRSIILVSMIGVILDEYSGDEITPAIDELQQRCKRFMEKQSGVETVIRRSAFGRRTIEHRVANPKRHEQYLSCVATGDRIWNTAIDRYAKQNLKIDIISTVVALYGFDPDVLAKHAKIKPEMIDAYRMEGDAGSNAKRAGAVVGGYMAELLAAEMGIKINGRLRALKNKIENEQKGAA